MKAPKPLLLALLLCVQQVLTAQVQWYQNQDGNNPAPYGTYASSIQPFNSSSFIACYQWQVQNDEYSWKISKTLFNGTETRTFMVTGIMANAEIRVRKNNSVYVLKRNYPYGQNPEYTFYRLNTNLDIVAERTLQLPGDYSIINLNAFEIDEDGNVYLAGDGQFPDGPGFLPASFVMKTSRNFETRWTRIDTVQTSYTRLHVDSRQRVLVIEDFYTTYPEVKIIRINRLGTTAVSSTVVPDAGRFSLQSMLDRNDHLLLYGGKMLNDTTQAAYLCRVSGSTGNVLFRKTFHTAPATQLNDLRMDQNGKLFSLATLFYPNEIQTKISRINPGNGQFIWSRSLSFNNDSCQFSRLVMNQSDRFYAVGEKKSCGYYAKGFALRVKKSGQLDGNMPSPDSVAYQRYHTLVDGIIDSDQELIAIGNTNDFDTTTYSSTYFRAFAARYHGRSCNPVTAKEEMPSSAAISGRAETETELRLQLFPNPAQDQLNISGINTDEFDKLYIYNMQGAVVLNRFMISSAIKLDISNLSDGVYLLVLRSSATLREKTVKFLVQH